MSANGDLRNLLSKIKLPAKFSSLAISSNTERDGDGDDNTLIHYAFVKYFDQKGQPYPEWLGVKTTPGVPQAPKDYSHSPYQPVYNSRPPPQQHASYLPQPAVQPAPQEQAPGGSTYTPRSSSRLQDMYNKSRQHSVPGAGYNASSQPAAPTLNRANTGGRLRERMLYANHLPSAPGARPNSTGHVSNPAGSGSARATWGKN